MSDGSSPLANEKHETYAVCRAKGVSQAEAYKSTVPFGTAHKGGNASLRVSGHRLEKRVDVAARIAYLRKRAQAAPEDSNKPLTRAEVIEVSLEVSDVLEATYRAALGSSAPPQALERLKAVLGAHLARQGKLDEGEIPLPDDTGGEIEVMMKRFTLEVCKCREH